MEHLNTCTFIKNKDSALNYCNRAKNELSLLIIKFGMRKKEHDCFHLLFLFNLEYFNYLYFFIVISFKRIYVIMRPYETPFQQNKCNE